MTGEMQDVKETARYKVFLNKSDKHVVVLRFPHRGRDHAFTEANNGSKPLEIRIKPKNGLVEVDVPLPDKKHINRRMAVQYGVALNQHNAATTSAPVGISGGFGATNPVRAKKKNNQRQRGGRRRRQQQQQHSDDDDDDDDDNEDGDDDAAGINSTRRPEELLDDFDGAMQSGRALNFLTLTGQIKPFRPTEPTYYLGNFQGDELHLTRVAAFCSLGVGLHHLDAHELNEKAARRATQEEEEEEEAAAAANTEFGGGSGAAAAEAREMKNINNKKKRATESSIVGMQVKSANEATSEESEWKRVLRELAEERWQRLEWVDEADQRSFDVFRDKLFLPPDRPHHHHHRRRRRIVAAMTRQQYLDSINVPRIDPALQNRRVKRDGTLADRADDDGASSSSSASSLNDGDGRMEP